MTKQIGMHYTNISLRITILIINIFSGRFLFPNLLFITSGFRFCDHCVKLPSVRVRNYQAVISCWNKITGRDCEKELSVIPPLNLPNTFWTNILFLEYVSRHYILYQRAHAKLWHCEVIFYHKNFDSFFSGKPQSFTNTPQIFWNWVGTDWVQFLCIRFGFRWVLRNRIFCNCSGLKTV